MTHIPRHNQRQDKKIVLFVGMKFLKIQERLYSFNHIVSKTRFSSNVIFIQILISRELFARIFIILLKDLTPPSPISFNFPNFLLSRTSHPNFSLTFFSPEPPTPTLIQVVTPLLRLWLYTFDVKHPSLFTTKRWSKKCQFFSIHIRQTYSTFLILLGW